MPTISGLVAIHYRNHSQHSSGHCSVYRANVLITMEICGLAVIEVGMVGIFEVGGLSKAIFRPRCLSC